MGKLITVQQGQQNPETAASVNGNTAKWGGVFLRGVSGMALYIWVPVRDNGVRRETKSEGSPRCISSLTNPNRIRQNQADKAAGRMRGILTSACVAAISPVRTRTLAVSQLLGYISVDVFSFFSA